MRLLTKEEMEHVGGGQDCVCQFEDAPPPIDGARFYGANDGISPMFTSPDVDSWYEGGGNDISSFRQPLVPGGDNGDFQFGGASNPQFFAGEGNQFGNVVGHVDTSMPAAAPPGLMDRVQPHVPPAGSDLRVGGKWNVGRSTFEAGVSASSPRGLFQNPTIGFDWTYHIQRR